MPVDEPVGLLGEIAVGVEGSFQHLAGDVLRKALCQFHRNMASRYFGQMVPRRILPAGFVDPCIPTPAGKPPQGPAECTRSSTMAIG
jgi:hypothetical protein